LRKVGKELLVFQNNLNILGEQETEGREEQGKEKSAGIGKVSIKRSPSRTGGNLLGEQKKEMERKKGGGRKSFREKIQLAACVKQRTRYPNV